MDAVISLWGSCLDRVRGVMENISVTLTGDDPGAALLMIIFYLVSIIAIILLLKLLSHILKSCFGAIFLSKKRRRQRPNVSPASASQVPHSSTVTPPAASNIPAKSSPLMETVAFLESFDEETLATQLASSSNLFLDKVRVPHVPDRLNTSDPSSLAKLELPEQLSAPEKAKIMATLSGCDLNALRQMLDAELMKEPGLTFQFNEASAGLAKSHQDREHFAEQEHTLCSNYNSGVDTFLSSSAELQQHVNGMSEKLSVARQSVSELKARRIALLEYLQEFRGEVDRVVAQVGELCVVPSPDIERISSGLQKSEGSLLTLKNTYLNVSGKRATLDETIAVQQDRVLDLHNQRLVYTATVSALRAKIEELERVEAERVAREEAERLAREDAARREQERKNATLANLHRQTKDAYTLNFDGVTPDMYESIASQISRSPCGADNRDISPVEPPPAEISPDEPAALADDENCGTSDVSNVAVSSPQVEPPVDHFALLREEWAAEREHKEAWDAEQAKTAANIERRKQELAQLLGSNKPNDKRS